MAEIEYLKCSLTEDEVKEYSQKLARETQNIDLLEDQKKQVTSDLKAQLDAANASCRRLSQLITNGYEYRNVECDTFMDDPEPGKKTTYRKDTGEVVKVERMTDGDRQKPLPLS